MYELQLQGVYSLRFSLDYRKMSPPLPPFKTNACSSFRICIILLNGAILIQYFPYLIQLRCVFINTEKVIYSVQYIKSGNIPSGVNDYKLKLGNTLHLWMTKPNNTIFTTIEFIVKHLFSYLMTLKTVSTKLVFQKNFF